MKESGRAIETPEVAEAEIVLANKIGLHARPSVQLTKLAKRFGAAIRLKIDDRDDWVDAKSIVKVMALKAPQGTTLTIRAEGDDASAAVAALKDLVHRDFSAEHVG